MSSGRAYMSVDRVGEPCVRVDDPDGRVMVVVYGAASPALGLARLQRAEGILEGTVEEDQRGEK